MTDLEFCKAQAQYVFELHTHAHAKRWFTKMFRRRLGYLCCSDQGIWFACLTFYGSRWTAKRSIFQQPVVSYEGLLLLYRPYLSDIDEAKVQSLLTARKEQPIHESGVQWR